MTEEGLKALEALANAAQNWPWEYDDRTGDVTVSKPHDVIAYDVHEDNGPFIAAAREAVPKLISEVRRLQAELAEADAVVAVPWLKMSPYVKPGAVQPQTWRCIQRHRARTGG